MSHINGHYKQDERNSIKELRVLDPSTGNLYDDRGNKCHWGFTPNPDGTWGNGVYTWVPDAALAADWYIMWADAMSTPPSHFAHIKPSYISFGPFTEEQARAEAVRRADRHKGAWCVFQVLAGNTVVVQPPAPPAPVTIWS